MTTLAEVLDLEVQGMDCYWSRSIPSVLSRTFGGQVAAQALMAAAHTVDLAYRVHSLHAYFLRGGSPLEPTEFLVDRVRDGGTFCTRSVTARQRGRIIFTMSASFHRRDEGDSHQQSMPDVPLPDELATIADPIGLAEWNGVWDRRWIPRPFAGRDGNTEAAQRLWIRHCDRLPDDPVVHACALVYLSDMDLLEVPSLIHPERGLQTASLDHSIWFLRDFRADEWLLHDQSSPSAECGRALSTGRLFDLSGQMVALVTQEVLVRYLRS